MATIQVVFSVVLIISSFFLLLPFPPSCDAENPLGKCVFDSIYQLGDSVSDTGNFIREGPIGATSVVARLPYGETFFRKATGRCSDGLLIIDYLALAAGLPFLNPYLNNDADFTHGVNFAVAGATALATSFLANKKILPLFTNSSLEVQLDWMSSHFNSICDSHTNCAQKLQRALFLVGEIGANDFNYAFLQGKTIEETKSIVHDVVRVIKDAVRRVIKFGAVRIVVPGNFPIGCSPFCLTQFQTNNSAAYDNFHCLKGYNDFARFYNDHLQKAIKELSKEHPHSIIVYADYYNALQWILQNASIFGFDAKSVQKACCGIGGDYDYSLVTFCGIPGVPVCPNPDNRMSWDGVHLTQQAHKLMAQRIIHDILPKLHCVA